MVASSGLTWATYILSQSTTKETACAIFYEEKVVYGRGNWMDALIGLWIARPSLSSLTTPLGHHVLCQLSERIDIRDLHSQSACYAYGLLFTS